MSGNNVRVASRQEAEENKAKQEFLRKNGINVKVNGSWGPWLLEQYDRLTANSNRANAAALAIPAAGYAIPLIFPLVLTAVKSLALPSISGSALAMSAPIALTVGSIASGIYDKINGIDRRVQVTENLRLQNVVAPSSTAVARRTPIPVYRIDNGYEDDTEALVDEVLIDSKQPAVIGPENKPDNEPEENDKKSWRKRIRDRIANRKSKNEPNNTQQTGGFKEGAIKVGKNLGKFYGKALTGAAYLTGAGVPVGIGYGIYKAAQPSPTAADSLIEQQSREIMELEKLGSAKRNLITIDSLRKALSQPIRNEGQQTDLPDAPVLRQLGDTSTSRRIHVSVSDLENYD